MDTVERLLGEGCMPPREARALLAAAWQVPREHLVAHPEAAVPTAVVAAYRALAARRRAGEPLAYLLGEKEFYGRPFRVTPDVLVPRPDTETLVAVALECLRPIRAPRVLELGTGSGCIAISLQLERHDAQVTATDVSETALAVAQANALALGADVTFLRGDWYAPVAANAAFDLIVSNPPYIAAADPHLDALTHEPAVALTDGDDGLHCLAILVAGARAHLDPGGWLALEHGFDQSAAVTAMLHAADFADVEVRHDAGGHPRVARGRA